MFQFQPHVAGLDLRSRVERIILENTRIKAEQLRERLTKLEAEKPDEQAEDKPCRGNVS